MQPSKVKISIITINYNNANGLEKTIVSVLNQGYENIEYLVIDGGSTDSSNIVIENYQSKLDYWVIEPDKGIYDAMNKGIKKATGDYLLFINSGDCLVNETVIYQALCTEFNSDLIYGNMYFLNLQKRREWIPPNELTFQMFYESTLPHPSTFIKRSLFNLVGLYNEDLRIVADWEFFMLAVCKYNCSYKHIDLFITDFDEEGISSDPENLNLIKMERETVFYKYFASFVKDYQQHELQRSELRKARHFLRVRKIVTNFFTSKS